ncbi:hypothetical protein JZO81_09270 [Enterococcus hulanensis]|uniref:glycosyltransferase n=1 Tax=Enterococcus hulanensis TaxID=2559929 RepID=UPI001A9183BF|nr:glycosyltransferase [Enterococcus hulanensis]MBO0411246.1 hypothetical protein [Enterococcus hulanensis]
MKQIDYSDIAENEELRSIYIFENIIKKNYKIGYSKINTCKEIPKQIIQYWDDKSIPEDVSSVMDTWSKSGISKVIYNKFSAKIFINKYGDKTQALAFDMCTHPAMRADFFRLCYLYERGGIYIDADDRYNNRELSCLFNDNRLKLHPLCYNNDSDSMVEIYDFLNDIEHKSNYIYYVNNDPIIAPPKHPLIELALSRAKYNIIQKKENLKDIQSVAGPGNLSASLVQYSIYCVKNNILFDVELLKNWDEISTPQWNLDYRKDQRNWRIWEGNTI